MYQDKKRFEALWAVVCEMICLLFVLMLFASCTSDAEKAAAKIELGQKYLFEAKYEEAILAFTDAIKIEPQNADLYIHRGDAYILAEQYEQAVADYNKATELGTAEICSAEEVEERTNDAIELSIQAKIAQEGLEAANTWLKEIGRDQDAAYQKLAEQIYADKLLDESEAVHNLVLALRSDNFEICYEILTQLPNEVYLPHDLDYEYRKIDEVSGKLLTLRMQLPYMTFKAYWGEHNEMKKDGEGVVILGETWIPGGFPPGGSYEELGGLEVGFENGTWSNDLASGIFRAKLFSAEERIYTKEETVSCTFVDGVLNGEWKHECQSNSVYNNYCLVTGTMKNGVLDGAVTFRLQQPMYGESGEDPYSGCDIVNTICTVQNGDYAGQYEVHRQHFDKNDSPYGAPDVSNGILDDDSLLYGTELGGTFTWGFDWIG